MSHTAIQKRLKQEMKSFLNREKSLVVEELSLYSSDSVAQKQLDRRLALLRGQETALAQEDGFEEIKSSVAEGEEESIIVSASRHRLARKVVLKKIKKNQRKNKNTAASGKSLWNRFEDLAKKLGDALDDLPTAISNALKGSAEFAAFIGSFCLAGAGLIIYFIEWKRSWRKLKKWYQQYEEDHTKQKQAKTRFAINAFSLGVATVGFLVAITIIIFTILGVAAIYSNPLTALLSPLIPALLLSIYTSALYHRAYTYHQVKNERKKAQNDYQQHEANLLENLEQLKKEIEKLQRKKVSLLLEYHTQEELKQHPDDFKKYVNLIKEINNKENQFADLMVQHQVLKKELKRAEEKQEKALRKLIFKCMEVIGSIGITTGMSLGALLAAGVIAGVVGGFLGSFTMGLGFITIPFLILVVGVSLNLLLKSFELYNESCDNKPWNWMRGIGKKLTLKSKAGIKRVQALPQVEGPFVRTKPVTLGTTRYSSAWWHRLFPGYIATNPMVVKGEASNKMQLGKKNGTFA